MRIADARVTVCSPGRNFTTLEVVADDGTVGVGDATLNGRELAVVSYLDDHLLPMLEGREVFATEDLWQLLYRGAYWRRGPVTMTAIGAIDMALWDLKGKHLGVPVHQLLGGRCREGLTAYAHAAGDDIDDALAAAGQLMEQGYRAVRLQSAVPGLRNTYGVPQAEVALRHTVGRPSEELWDTGVYLRHVPELFRKARDELGPDVDLLHDAHHRLTPNQAGWLGAQLEPFHLFWLEDPVPAEQQRSYRAIRQHTTIPIAVGEVFNTVHDCSQLVEEELIDHLRLSVAHGGGLTPLRKLAALAELHHVRMSAHGPEDVSPIGLAAALHHGISLTNFGIQEHARHSADAYRVFRTSHRFEQGRLHPGEEPGLGVSFDAELAASFPYEQRYLPVARLRDGSVTDW